MLRATSSFKPKFSSASYVYCAFLSVLWLHAQLHLCPDKGAAEQVVVSGILPILAVSLRHRGPLTRLTAKLVAELAKECKWFDFIISYLLIQCMSLALILCWLTLKPTYILYHCSFTFVHWGGFFVFVFVSRQLSSVKVSVMQVWLRRCCACWPAQTKSCSYTLQEPSHACPMTAVSKANQ